MAGEGRPEVVNRVRAVRMTAGLKQQELADRARISLRTVTFIETDPAYVPSVGVALKLSKALGCRVEDLFSLVGDEADLIVIDAQLQALEIEQSNLVRLRTEILAARLSVSE